MIIHKYITHVLSKEADEPVLNDYEGKVSLDVDKFLQKAIKKVIKEEHLRKAKFNNHSENLIKNLCDNIIYDEESFVENSKEIAAYLFDVMKTQVTIDSCDLVVCLYTIKDERYVAIIKMDYKKIYNHAVEFKDDKFNIQIIQNEKGISETIKPKQCALIGANGLNDEYDLRVLDIEAEKEERTSAFLKEFIDCRKIVDDTYKTKVFESYTNGYITNAYSGEDLKLAEDIRHTRDYMLTSLNVFDIEKFIANAIPEKDRDNFKNFLVEKDISEDFNIDKKYIEKKLKNRSVKTDTGINIKVNREDFNNPMKVAFNKREDGAYDIVLKGVKFLD